MSRRTPLIIATALVLTGGLCWRFPLFHIVPLKQAEQEQSAGVFDAAAVASDFWETKLLPATEQAVELTQLFSALAADPDAARNAHGRTLGIGGATMFLLRGSGKIVEVGEDAIVVELDGTGAKVSLSVGLLFGNTVRDASGLLDVSRFPDSQEFNELSTHLNGIVESKVAPALLEQAVVGKAIRFAGCAELEEGAAWDVPPIIPLKVEWP